MTKEELIKYKHSAPTLKPNFIKIPVNNFGLNDEGAHMINEIFDYVSNTGYKNIIRTNSGGISYKSKFPSYDVRISKTCYEITLLDSSGLYRFQFRSNGSEIKDGENQEKMYGRQAFALFKKKCKEANIDLESMAISNGVAVKTEIEKPYIKLATPMVADRIFTNAHHIDFHNSYPAGLCNKHPEFKSVVEPLYQTRKTNPENKAVLNLTVGFMQSISGCNARWAHLAKDAIADNNRRIEDIANRLRESGRIILSYNTDGIWYYGDIYHGEGEGKNLGEWENDHINCKFRAKSAGAYEFIEGDKYYAVVRGETRLDLIKPRTEWVWGDIYNREAVVIKYEVREDGIYRDGVRC